MARQRCGQGGLSPFSRRLLTEGVNTPRFLFVYGTLRRGYDNRYATLLRETSQFVGEDHTAGTLEMLGDYTALVPDATSTNLIAGEIFELVEPDQLWGVVDEYEGADYQRCIVPVTLDSGETLQAWVYVYRT